MESTKINFFARVIKAIFKFDEYDRFITEPTKKAIIYLIKLMILFAITISSILTYQMTKNTKKVFEIINNEFPEFTITDNQLQIEENYEYYFEDIDLNVIITEEPINYMNLTYNNFIVLLKDKTIINYNGFSQELLYKDIQISSKEDIAEISKTREAMLLKVSLWAIMIIISFVVYSVKILIDIVTLVVLGLIINLIIRTEFKLRQLFAISLYSMTLPAILYLIYMIINVLFGITIKYFEVAYNAIGYIYLITVLLIMKSDIIKNTQELQKILDEQKKVREELEREKREEKEKQEEGNREKEKKKKEQEKDKPEAEPQAES